MISDKDMVELSTVHAYVYYNPGDNMIVNGNNYYVVDIYNEDNGMEYGTDAMLVKNDQEEYALIYTGSDKRNDFINDWVINNGRNAFKLDVPQYEEGLELYSDLSVKYDISRIGGVSLGGGVVTYIGINDSNVSVVSINPSPQIFKIDKDYENIITIVDKRDVLFYACVIGGRREYYVKNFYVFDRGNSFLKNIKLNHIGYDKKSHIYLDGSIPFDIYTHNINSRVIDLKPNEILTLNSNLKLYFHNSKYEIKAKITPHLEETLTNYRDNYTYQKIINNIITNIKEYMINQLPTLHSYIDFSYFFEEIASISNSCAYLALDSILDFLTSELKINYIYQQLYTDTNNAFYNVNSIDNHVHKITSACDTLVDNIRLKDMNMNVDNISLISSYKIKENSFGRNLKYLYLLEYAKQLFYTVMQRFISNHFSAIDEKLDMVIRVLKSSVGLIGDVASIISKEVARKIEVIEQILQELYIFDIGQTVYNIFVICIDEIISIVLPKELDDKIQAFQYLEQVLTNSYTVYNNYSAYLKEYKSGGITTILKNAEVFKEKYRTYTNYLSAHYK